MRSTYAAASAALLVAAAIGGGGASSAGGADAKCTTIVVDPGHDARANLDTEPIGPGSSRRKIKDGGGTRGAATGTPESVVNLRISRRLRKLLLADGYCVRMTRTRNAGRSMGNVRRARIANRAHAALFVRVHADGSSDRSRHGSSTLYPAYHRGWTADVLPQSRVAARRMQRALVRTLHSRDLGTVRRSDITGFNWSNVPVVLAEVGFLTNPREDRRLSSRRGARRAARALERGVRAFAPPRK